MKQALREGISGAEKNALKERRQRLFSELDSQGQRSILIVAGAGLGKSLYGYRPCQNLEYLCACPEPDALAVFVLCGSLKRSLLFKKERDLQFELWNGPMMSLAEAREHLGFDHVYSLDQLEVELSAYLKECEILYFEESSNETLNLKVARALELSRARRNGLEIRENLHLLAKLRLVKDSVELARLKKASDVSSLGHEAAMKFAKPGLYEYEVQAELESVFRKEGAQGLGYQSIVASGSNACCLHYNVNSCMVEEGDLVLIDAGACYQGYTADITRTFPANGKFSLEQALIYDIVLDVQKACIAKVKPGESHASLQNFAVSRMCERLYEEGVIAVNPQECVEREDYKRFYAHSLGHWLGRDVHDLGPSMVAGKPKPFEAGNVVTIEPGIYFQIYDTEIPERFRGIGIRIEDDIVVTDTGHLNLTSALKERAEIESLIKRARS